MPEGWSQVACDVLAQKYFRKAGVPKALKPVPEEGVPEFLWRHESDRRRETTGETFRASRCSTAWPAPGPIGAGRAAISTREADARAFYDELCHMLAAQKAAPNSPQWFNTGLHWAYGIDGPSQGHYYVDPQDAAG